MNIFSALGRIRNLLRGALYRMIIKNGGGTCGKGLRVEHGFRLRHGPHAGISIGTNVYIGVGSVFDCPPPGRIQIGNNVTLTHGVFISSADLVVIGNDTLIGEYTSIRDADHQMHISPVPIRNQPMLPRQCVIGQDVWIGRGSAILAGTVLDDGCIIGANSLVKGHIPSNAIAVGAPARVVGNRPDTTHNEMP